jgi:PKD domain
VGHAIRVQEAATDSSGEGSPAQSASTASVGALELHADAGENLTAVAGQEVPRDGSASTPASEITSYRWEFGDSQVYEGSQAIVRHTYTEPTATGHPDLAKLTVKHGAETSAPSEVEVTCCGLRARPKR